MIPREVIDEILSRNDIESLIGSYVSLKRAGSNLKGLCPFHSEKTPSFTVFPKDNSFYCFGCGVGGDAITFIREIEHLDYPDAVAFLAKRVGINVLPDADASPAGGKKIDKERILQMNVDAAKYYHAALFSESEKARAALRYFTEKRGLSMATIRHFGLGFAPDGFDVFTKYMLSKGYTHEELIAGFLTGKSERGNYYDAFRNRVMFPIIDVSGRVIAFGGRVMDDSQPKYKNSSDTPVFKKTRNLFALNFARQSCAETMILCEGYMDVIAMHAAGFTNAVATLGTAITADQARLMSRYTTTPTTRGRKRQSEPCGCSGTSDLRSAYSKFPMRRTPTNISARSERINSAPRWRRPRASSNIIPTAFFPNTISTTRRKKSMRSPKWRR